MEVTKEVEVEVEVEVTKEVEVEVEVTKEVEVEVEVTKEVEVEVKAIAEDGIDILEVVLFSQGNYSLITYSLTETTPEVVSEPNFKYSLWILQLCS